MRKLGYKGKKTAKIIHICFIIIWVGGLISWLPLMINIKTDNYSLVYNTYLNLQTLAYAIVGWAGIGTLLTGLVLGIFTDWKLFKFQWVNIKFYTFFLLTFFEYFFVQLKLFKSVSLLHDNGAAALSDPLFLSNHSAIILGVSIQLIVFLGLIIISFFKPLTQKERLKKN